MSSITAPDIGSDAAGEVGVDREVLALDLLRRHQEVAIAHAVRSAELMGHHLLDGHRSVVGWGRATCNWSTGEATRFARLGRALHRLPLFDEVASAGRIPVGHAHALARVVANRRVEPLLDESEELLVGYAQELDYDDYVTFLRRWESLADQDGANRDHDLAHDRRHASLSIVGDRVYLDAVGGLAQGTMMREILEQFEQAQFQEEWDAGRAVHGDLMSKEKLQRTPDQRRWDALYALFKAAAGSEEVGGEVLVNILVDEATLAHHLAKAAGADVEPLDPARADERRCETTRGDVLSAADLLAAALIGRVRRVVLDSEGVIIDLGRRSRLFTGAARDAVLLHHPRCIWAGCTMPAHRCEADHLQPHAAGGPTSPANGAPLCDHHNRWKARGYRTWRDEHGRWHIARPDGSEIGWHSPVAGE